jgi:hypothetical protein
MASPASTAAERALDPAAAACRNRCVVPEPVRQVGVLALLGNPTPMQPLLAHLRGLGMQVDTVADLAEARTAFFGSGGHDCLVVAPDVRPGIAAQVAGSLRAVDPELPMATFGPALGQRPRRGRDAMLASYHPSSRAGTGALVRFLRGVRLR